MKKVMKKQTYKLLVLTFFSFIAYALYSCADENKIEVIEYITLEVGEASGCVPVFLDKLFPIAIEKQPRMKNTELKKEFAMMMQNPVIKQMVNETLETMKRNK